MKRVLMSIPRVPKHDRLSVTDLLSGHIFIFTAPAQLLASLLATYLSSLVDIHIMQNNANGI